MPLDISGVIRPSSGGSAQMLFGVITCVGCVWNRILHAVNTQPPHVITPNSICAEPPEDWRVTPETYRSIDS
jgi:hypothetical protein